MSLSQSYIEGEKTHKKRNVGIGRKADGGKDRWDLLPIGPIRWVVKVLTFGSCKYDDNNWMHVVEDRPDAYYAAALRHLTAWRDGQHLDPESKLPHLAHCICCVLFLLWRDICHQNDKQNG